MLYLLDVLLSIVHFLIIGFNLLGWAWKPLRIPHLISILLTGASWLVLGIWFGLGYCPITNWQWQVKRKLGETHLPASFIKYYADKIFHKQLNEGGINTLTAAGFGLAGLLSIILTMADARKEKNILHPKKRKAP